MSKGHLGHNQGDMKPVVEDYQMPTKAFAGKDMNRTTEYISRNDVRQDKMANDIKKQDYKGKY
jgi:hypothetical protein